MDKEYSDYIKDILTAMEKAEIFVKEMDYGFVMRDIEGLKKILQEHKYELESEYGVKEIGVFGSYIKKREDTTSDIDILVEFQKAVDLLTFVHLKNYLSDLLKLNVDLVMKKALKPNIGKRILKEVVYV